ncbi:MAG: hypothetical protein CL677_01505 [Bdellovibrionaceae bacterium]|mgnify:CR=1 FL=1|nr:hypothetical protein [Pseudobdellovibrionaceae bacterium]
MRHLTILFIFIIPFVCLAQEEETEESKEKESQEVELEISKYNIGSIFRSNKNSSLPREVIDYVEKIYIQDYKRQDAVRTESMSKAEMIGQFRRQILEVSVLFRNIDTFFEKPLYFNLNQGGGSINLSEQLGSKSGRFNIRMIAKKPENVDDMADFKSNVRVLFLSNSIKRDAAGVQWGTGCDVFFDISRFFKKSLMTEEGVIFSTVSDQHISALAGRFIFFYTHLNDVYMSMVSFVDPTKSELQCASYN